MDPKLFQRTAELLSEVSGAPVASLRAESTPGTTPSWDSVANLSFLAAVEEEWNIAILTSEAVALKSLGDVVALVAKKRAASSSSPS